MLFFSPFFLSLVTFNVNDFFLLFLFFPFAGERSAFRSIPVFFHGDGRPPTVATGVMVPRLCAISGAGNLL